MVLVTAATICAVAWEPNNDYLRGGCGAKPQHLMSWLWIHTTKMSVVVLEPKRPLFEWWFGTQTSTVCGGFGPKPQLFVVVCEPNRRMCVVVRDQNTLLCLCVWWFGAQTTTIFVVVLAPKP
jgi:hypothetical protein